MLTLEKFRLRFPEFASVSDSRIEFYIEDTLPQFSSCFWGRLLDKGQAYYIAHFLIVESRQENEDSDPAYPASNKKAGEVSEGYTAPDMTDWAVSEIFYESTSYGQYYMTLRNQCAPVMLTVGLGQINLPGC